MMEVNSAPNDYGGDAVPDDDWGNAAPDEWWVRKIIKIKKERRKWEQEETQVILYFLN